MAKAKWAYYHHHSEVAVVIVRIPLVCVALAHALACSARAQSKPTGPVGTWRGTSTCLVRPSSCNDETVVYRITPMKAADSVAIDGWKIVGGDEQEMGTFTCRFDAASNRLVCVIPQGTWEFTVRGDSRSE